MICNSWTRIAVLTAMALVLGSATAGKSGFNIDVRRLFGAATNIVKAVAPISEEKEVQIGARLASALLGATPLVDDIEAQRYVNRVGMWLALQTERPRLPWRFGVLDTATVNAFAAPGGYVFITKGLFQIMRSEAELAGVLAHEIGHVLRRHHLVAIQKQARTALAADVAGMMISQNAQLFDAIAKIGLNLYARGLDREDEFEADGVGVVVAARGGYAPGGLPSVLATLAGMSVDDANLSLFFSTHPGPGERIRLLDEKMTGRLDAASGLDVSERFERYRAAFRN